MSAKFPRGGGGGGAGPFLARSPEWRSLTLLPWYVLYLRSSIVVHDLLVLST